jgi:hypothetical protein
VERESAVKVDIDPRERGTLSGTCVWKETRERSSTERDRGDTRGQGTESTWPWPVGTVRSRDASS